MLPGRVIVLDIGKTLAKLSLWGVDGRLIEQRQRYNERVESGKRLWLDAAGIERWAREVLTDFAGHGSVAAIVPVAHGAAAAIIREGRLACPIPDYEDAIDPALRAAYDLWRDPFAKSGSPALPDGLNLGVQLARLGQEQPGLFSGDASIVPWPQYWAWRLCGVLASEVSSLGCHTDLWFPTQRRPSDLARARGWAERLAPLRQADEVLGSLTVEWTEVTGLSSDVQVYCGAHDSNAALLAARAFPQIAGRGATVITTGTWFISMRLPESGSMVEIELLPHSRDCLVNVDVAGQPIPSARFMGGREVELLGGLDGGDPAATLQALATVLENGCMALPTWVPGVGPYPRSRGRWLSEPRDPLARRAAAALYAALMVDASLELIGTRDCLLLEGRFASAEIFVRALASLRSESEVFVNRGSEAGVAYGALRLVDPTLPTPAVLERVRPLEFDLMDYKGRWRDAIANQRAKLSDARK